MTPTTFFQSTNVTGSVGGSVPATLSLTLGTPASFGAFQPGVARDYAASTTANVISTAGDGVLSVADPSSNATGHLVNGSFSLAQALKAKASSAGGTGSAFAPLGHVAAAAADLHGADQQRPGHDRLPAVDRRQRAAAHGRVLQDADVHAVHYEPIAVRG